MEGTLTVLRLVMECEHAPTLHFMSSVGALPATVSSEKEAEEKGEGWMVPDMRDMRHMSGYSQTKVVCERLLYQAKISLGVRVKLYRPCAVSSHSKTGFTNISDLGTLLVAAIVHSRAVVKEATLRFSWVPVDFVGKCVARMIVHEAHNRKRRTDYDSGKQEDGGEESLVTITTTQQEEGAVFVKKGEEVERDVFNLSFEGPLLRDVVLWLRNQGIYLYLSIHLSIYIFLGFAQYRSQTFYLVFLL